jgi:hypothetical protein
MPKSVRGVMRYPIVWFRLPVLFSISVIDHQMACSFAQACYLRLRAGDAS